MITKSNGQTICNINSRCKLEYLFAVIDEIKASEPDTPHHPEAQLKISLSSSAVIRLALTLVDEDNGETYVIHRDIEMPYIESYAEVLKEINAIVDRMPVVDLVKNDYDTWVALYHRALVRVKAEVLAHLEKFD